MFPYEIRKRSDDVPVLHVPKEKRSKRTIAASKCIPDISTGPVSVFNPEGSMNPQTAATAQPECRDNPFR